VATFGDIPCFLVGVDERLSLYIGIEHDIGWFARRNIPLQLARFVCRQHVILLGSRVLTRPFERV
jgi:hypothetical protein